MDFIPSVTEEYLDGAKIRREIYASGQILSEQRFVQSNNEYVADGPSRQWYLNGAMKEEALYKRGRLDGIRTIRSFKAFGKSSWREEQTWRDGVPNGRWRRWNYADGGSVVSEVEYRNGKVVQPSADGSSAKH